MNTERKITVKKIKFAAKIASVCFAAAALSAVTYAAKLTDIDGHWSKDYVEYGVEKGYISGYLDSTFKPDGYVTRAEFSKMVNSALKIKNTADISFSDIGKNDWYYDEVRKAVSAGYVNGYDDNSFRANSLITRQEAAAILSRISTRPEKDLSINSFKDKDYVDSWAKEYMEFAYSKGFFTGDDYGNLCPQDSLTRGQAAKLLYTLLKAENIYNGDCTIIRGDAVCSETIYTDNIYYTPITKDAELKLDGCVVLGTVYMKNLQSADLTAEDSYINAIDISGAYADIELDGDSTVKSVNVTRPASLSGDGYGTVKLNGSKLASETTSISADPSSVVIYSDALLKADELSLVEIESKTSLTVQSGTIDSMKVSSNAKNSVITLASGVTVNNLSINASCSFMGAGKIKKAENNAKDVSFATEPDKITGSGSTSSDSSASSGFSPKSVSPENGETKVGISANFLMTFADNVYTKDGKEVSASYVAKYVELRKKTSTGTEVDYDAAVSGKRIRLYPSSSLSYGTKYYVIVPAGIFADEDGNTNPKLTYYFTTKSSSSDDDDDDSSSSSSSATITFTPKSGAKDVAFDDTIKITFSSAVRKSNGDALTSSYLSNSAIELREKSTSGTKVDITAEINSSKKVITVVPDEALKPDTKYYLVIVSGTMEYSSSGKNISKTTSYFTTADTLSASLQSPKNGDTAVAADSEIVLKFNTEIYRPSGSNVTTSYLADEAIELRAKTASGTKIEFTATISSDRKTVTLIPSSSLDAATKYYVVIPKGTLATDSGEENAKMSFSFTTASVMAPAITPANKDTSVDPAKDIVIKFSDALYDKSGNKITAEYVKENVVTLRKSSSTGTRLDYTVQISSDYKTITITPVKTFSSKTTYYVAVAKNTLYNSDKKGNSAASSTFTTAASSKPDFIPYDGEENVSVKSVIEITFEDNMYQIGGDTLTTTYIKNNVIELYKDSYDGEAQSFSVTLSSDKQTITVKPSSNLDGNTKYVVCIRKSSLENSDGEENPFYSSSFTTAETVTTGCEITPENKAKDVPVNTQITIEFNSPVYRTNGNIASDAYIANNAVELRAKSSSGTKVACTASISEDNKTITLVPEKNLSENTTYYVKVLSGSLVYADGSKVSSASSNFTTNNGTASLGTFTVKKTGSTFVTVEAEATADAVIYISAAGGSETVTKSAELEALEKTEITISGLASNTSYKITAYIIGEDGKKSAEKSATAKTGAGIEMSIGEITEDGAVVTVKANSDGKLGITYKNKSTGKTETRISGINMSEGETKSFELIDLDSKTAYEVTAEFTDEADGVTTASEKFTTLEKKEEVLEITEITLTDESGNTYTESVKNGKAEFSIEKSTYVKLAAGSSVKNAEVSVNGAKAVKPGAYSANIDVTPGETAEIEVVLKSLDTQNTVECTVKVSVHG